MAKTEQAQALDIAREAADRIVDMGAPTSSIIVMVALTNGGYAAKFVGSNQLEGRGLLEAAVDGLREQLGYALRMR